MPSLNFTANITKLSKKAIKLKIFCQNVYTKNVLDGGIINSAQNIWQITIANPFPLF